MIGEEKWTDNKHDRHRDYDTERAQAFGQDQDLETRQPWRPPVVPPNMKGQAKLYYAMANRGLPVTRSAFQRAWDEALAVWDALPQEFLDAWQAWTERLARDGMAMSPEEFSELMKQEPKWEEWNDEHSG